MEVGIDSFAARFDEAGLAASPVDRMHELLERIEHADHVGLDVFGIGEHHKREFLDSAPPVILAAAASRSRRIRLTSAVSVLSAADPVRLFQQFATLDLLSEGRAEMVVGRGSSIEAFPLFGYDLQDYDALFADKLDLLLNVPAALELALQEVELAQLFGLGDRLSDATMLYRGLGGPWGGRSASLFCALHHFCGTPFTTTKVAVVRQLLWRGPEVERRGCRGMRHCR
jgi:alkanesulfonate monooxygenase SsuD/methylene tetrahydromethanopterin reductase-like flavin-dependent oxidoreductase (luciferase family)